MAAVRRAADDQYLPKAEEEEFQQVLAQSVQSVLPVLNSKQRKNAEYRAKKFGLDPADVGLALDAADAGAGSSSPGSTSASSSAPVVHVPRCYVTGQEWTEDVFGVLCKWDKNKLVSPCELVSKAGFEEMKAGRRIQSSTKAVFTHFLPVWVNDSHAGVAGILTGEAPDSWGAALDA